MGQNERPLVAAGYCIAWFFFISSLVLLPLRKAAAYAGNCLQS